MERNTKPTGTHQLFSPSHLSSSFFSLSLLHTVFVEQMIIYYENQVGRLSSNPLIIEYYPPLFSNPTGHATEVKITQKVYILSFSICRSVTQFQGRQGRISLRSKFLHDTEIFLLKQSGYYLVLFSCSLFSHFSKNLFFLCLTVL